MTEIVLGIGTSHSPLLAIPAALWASRGNDDLRRKEIFLADGRVVTYEALAREVDNRYASCATVASFQSQAAEAQTALDRLASDLKSARLDLILLIGDDQEELFGTGTVPAIAVYTGEEIVMHPKNEVNPNLPEWYRLANETYLMDVAHRHPGAPQAAHAIIDSLIASGVDLTIATEVRDARVAGFGHAYGFVISRLLKRQPIPVLPVLLNTYYPPNVPTPARCYEVGKRLAEACRKIPGNLRIGVVASGGLTHFATDEEFDRKILTALRDKDTKALTSLPVLGLRSGNSEILNWIMAAGALEQLSFSRADYIPVHRTPAGTGIGLAFCTWH